MSDDLLKRLRMLQVSACNCGTKTPEAKHHGESCTYRGLCEAEDRIRDLEASNATVFAAGVEAAAKVAEKVYAGHGSILRTPKANNYEHAGRKISAAIRALSPTPAMVMVPAEGTYTHRKGGTYDSLGIAHIQSDVPLSDMDEVVVYRARKDGTLWARRAVEFEDGRFTRAMIEAATRGKE